ncbi:MAG: ROK family protein [Deinococcota bacterium]
MSLHTLLLNHLSQQEMSLADMHTISSVSLPTVRKTVQTLLESQWIAPAGQAETTGGRPATLFGLNNDVYALIGVHLQLPGIHLITTNLNGDILDSEDKFGGVVPSPEEAIQAISSYLASVKQKLPERNLLGIGIASPGFTDPDTGEIISVGRVKGWDHVALCKKLEARENLAVSIINDIDAMAVAELRRQPFFQNGQNFIYVGLDEGIKISIFLGDQLYTGSFGNAGLIAQSMYQQNERSKNINLLSLEGIDQIFLKRLGQLTANKQNDYSTIMQKTNSRQRFQHVLELSTTDMHLCGEIVADLNEALATVIANIIYLLQPHRVLIGGVLSKMPQPSYQALESAIRQRLPNLLNKTIFQQSQLNAENSASLGASYHHLRLLFKRETAKK